ncbi:uncharacterized protein EKO05_0004440 [Ascochyta rabiei]|uniref:uncharacterized protein n=1 Tax=Didymella rabiei TaxID=5454 RepID=UPI002202B4FC|nr:uncharacterized protein EKO05_0004440 [Ascochyta rabiei]UPX13946.1 hypothetical protein EKO05_0004440 [Ascochyta rabiei]
MVQSSCEGWWKAGETRDRSSWSRTCVVKILGHVTQDAPKRECSRMTTGKSRITDCEPPGDTA